MSRLNSPLFFLYALSNEKEKNQSIEGDLIMASNLPKTEKQPPGDFRSWKGSTSRALERPPIGCFKVYIYRVAILPLMRYNFIGNW